MSADISSGREEAMSVSRKLDRNYATRNDLTSTVDVLGLLRRREWLLRRHDVCCVCALSRLNGRMPAGSIGTHSMRRDGSMLSSGRVCPRC